MPSSWRLTGSPRASGASVRPRLNAGCGASHSPSGAGYSGHPFGQTFDYYVEEKYSEAAQPGVMVRVRFGGQRVNGIIWKRTDTSETPESSLWFIERVVIDRVLVSESMRNDATLIADAFGGTRANILRLAVPPRVARVEQEQRIGNRTGIEKNGRIELLAKIERESYEQLQRQYGNIDLLRTALEGQRFQAFVLDPLPGSHHWRQCVAWMVAAALLQGKLAVLVLPTMREIEDMAETLQSIGLRCFAPTQSSNGAYGGDFAILNAQMAPAERYRAYLAISGGQVRCVIGTRAAMYAPVDGNALFLILDDVCYQDADGMMPYANARGVLRLRAKAHNGVFVAMANARSVQSQWETDAAHVGATQVSGFSTPIHAFPAVTKEASPWIRWLNRDELARLADSTIGARVPHTAVRVLSKALESGPVLLSIPQDGIGEALSCAKCHRQARCSYCTVHWNGYGMGRCVAVGAVSPLCSGLARHAITNVCAWFVWVPPELRRSSADCFVACPLCFQRRASHAALFPISGLRRSWSSPLPAQNPVYVGGTPRNANTGPWPFSTHGPACTPSALTRA